MNTIKLPKPKKTGEFAKGAKLVRKEYEVREINAHGDACDLIHADSQDEAMRIAEDKMSAGSLAVAVEYHVRRYPAHLHDEPDVYERVIELGDRNALMIGGWIDEDDAI